MTFEVLEADRPGRRRRTRLVLLPGLLAVLAVLAVVVWSSQVQDRANDSLVASVQQAQDDGRIGEARVLSTLTYASPMIWSSAVSGTVRADLRDLVQRTAAQYVADLDALAVRVRALQLLPWQSAQAAARDGVLDFIDLVRVRFVQIASDARNLGSALAPPPPSTEPVLGLLRASGADVGAIR